MTWAIVFGSIAMLAWLIGGETVVLTSALWIAGLVVLTVVWFMSRPLWRQGHGARIRRLRPPAGGQT
jgi:hypothetical protein